MIKSSKTRAANVPWMDIAMGEIGTAEIKGAEHSDRVVEYHQSVTLRASDDETPWCSSFANFCLKQAGVEGTDSAAALSFRKWGQPVKATELRYGDVCVIDRGAGKGHVGFFVGFDRSGRVLLLGGNQDDEVNTTAFPLDAFAHFRRPRKLGDTTTAKIAVGGGIAATVAPTIINTITGGASAAARAGSDAVQSVTEAARASGDLALDDVTTSAIVSVVDAIAPGYGEIVRLAIVIGTTGLILFNRFKDLRNRGI